MSSLKINLGPFSLAKLNFVNLIIGLIFYDELMIIDLVFQVKLVIIGSGCNLNEFWKNSQIMN